MAQGRRRDHQKGNKRDDIRERATMKKFELKREELEGAPATN
jgi:hypothetical protein